MTRFFVIAGLIVLVLVFAPVLLLSRANREFDRFAGKTVLYNSYPEKIKTIDPTLCGDTISSAMQANVYESLYAYHYLKRPVEVVPLLAEAMPETSADGKTYTIKIRKDVQYAPNPCFAEDKEDRPQSRHVRAQDFVLSFKRAADSHMLSPMAWSFLSGQVVGLDDYHDKTKNYKQGDFSRYDLAVEGVQALDDHTLQIKLTAPFPALIYVLALHLYCPIPSELIHHYLERKPMKDRTAEITRAAEAIGTGPYVITTWERGSRIIFERNPLFHKDLYPSEGSPGDKEAGLLTDAGKQTPFIDVLYYQCITEDFSSWMQFLAGQQDVSAIPREVFSQVIRPDKSLSEQWEKRGIRLVIYEDPAVYWFGFNMDDPVMKASPSLRKAMCLSYDVESYIDVLFNGRGRRAVNTLPSSFPVYQEAGPGPYYRYDVNAARQMLEQAKKELAAAGLLQRDGNIPPIAIDLGGQDEVSRRQGEFSKQQFEAVGIPVKIQLNDWPTLQQKVHMKQTQVYAMGWHADYPDPENFLQLYYGPNIEKGTNSTNYRNPRFDELYRKIIVMPDSPERRAICTEMVKMINEDVPVLLLSEPISFVLVYDHLGNYKRHPIGYGMIKYVRLDSDRQHKARGG